jgi:hypothetical protein
LVGWLDYWLVGWLVGCLVGHLVGWMVGRLAGWLAGWLVGWLSGNAQVSHASNTIIWPFWTISPKAMGLMIWLGIHKGRKVARMYVPMSKLENKTLTKSLGPL